MSEEDTSIPLPKKIVHKRKQPYNREKGVQKKPAEMVGFESKSKCLLVLADSHTRNDRGEILWRCICACGRETLKTTNRLRRGCQTCGECKKVERKRIERKKYNFLLINSKRRSIDSLTDSDKYSLLQAYLSNGNLSDLEDTWNIRRSSLLPHFKGLRDKLVVAIELGTKMNEITLASKVIEPIDIDLTIKNVLKQYSSSELSSLLSPVNSTDLTASEIAFAFILHSTGSMTTALKESEFSKVLGSNSAFIQVLGNYLLMKPNVQSFLKKLESDQELQLDVTKGVVQNELVSQIYQLKDKIATSTDSRTGDRGYLLKAIELLGKTIGAFQDKITVEQVDPGQALDKLIEMAKVESTYTVLDEDGSIAN